MIIIEAVLMGIFATFFMDFLAGILAKRNIIYPFISPDAVGRWFLYIFKGKLIHKDINQTPVLKNEKLWCLISHYLIGIALSGVYLVIGSNFAIVREQLLMPLLFGIATVFFPGFGCFLVSVSDLWPLNHQNNHRLLELILSIIQTLVLDYFYGLFYYIVSLFRGL